MNYRFLYLIALICFSCNSQKQVSKEELKNYALDPSNGLFQSVMKNSVTLELIYRPKELVLLQEADPQTDSWTNSMKELDSLDYFILRISKEGKEIENTFIANDQRFQNVVAYLSDGIGSDIHMLVGDEAVVPEQSLFTQTFGGSNATSILLVFESYLDKRNENFKVVLNDSELGIGRAEFDFTAKSMKRIPKLKF